MTYNPKDVNTIMVNCLCQIFNLDLLKEDTIFDAIYYSEFIISYETLKLLYNDNILTVVKCLNFYDHKTIRDACVVTALERIFSYLIFIQKGEVLTF